MKTLSASKAAEAVGKSIPTITRAIKSGKLSATKLDGGGYEIDPAELFRVWPAVTHETDKKGQMSGGETPSNLNTLQARVDALTAEKLERLERENEALRADRDEWREQARALRLLTDQRPSAPEHAPAAPQEAPQKRKGFFGWLGSRTA